MTEQVIQWEPYRPSNGTEGQIFMEAWCDLCKRDQEHQESGGVAEGCPIIANTFVYEPNGAGRLTMPNGLEPLNARRSRRSALQRGASTPPICSRRPMEISNAMTKDQIESLRVFLKDIGSIRSTSTLAEIDELCDFAIKGVQTEETPPYSDAVRYRWLRETTTLRNEGGGFFIDFDIWIPAEYTRDKNADIDRAIDKAIAEWSSPDMNKETPNG
jgi:hypothetical protein